MIGIVLAVSHVAVDAQGVFWTNIKKNSLSVPGDVNSGVTAILEDVRKPAAVWRPAMVLVTAAALRHSRASLAVSRNHFDGVVDIGTRLEGHQRSVRRNQGVRLVLLGVRVVHGLTTAGAYGVDLQIAVPIRPKSQGQAVGRPSRFLADWMCRQHNLRRATKPGRSCRRGY